MGLLDSMFGGMLSNPQFQAQLEAYAEQSFKQLMTNPDLQAALANVKAYATRMEQKLDLLAGWGGNVNKSLASIERKLDLLMAELNIPAQADAAPQMPATPPAPLPQKFAGIPVLDIEGRDSDAPQI